MGEPAAPCKIERLTKRHDRGSFSCGEPPLDEFLRRFDDRGISRTYVATRIGSPVVLGYYSVQSGAVTFDVLPDEDRRRLPRYPIPVVRLARLAVDHQARGQKVGETLLMHALHKAARLATELGIYAVEVQAKNDAARAFYARYGFVALLDDPHHMYLAVTSIAAAFGEGESQTASR